MTVWRLAVAPLSRLCSENILRDRSRREGRGLTSTGGRVGGSAVGNPAPISDTASSAASGWPTGTSTSFRVRLLLDDALCRVGKRLIPMEYAMFTQAQPGNSTLMALIGILIG